MKILMISTIDLLDITDYAAGFKGSFRTGSLLSKSKTQFFGLGDLPTTDRSLHLVSACLTQNAKAHPHRINIRKTISNREVELKGNCSCKANTERCKHIITFMPKLERLTLSEIPAVSKTDVGWEWSQVSERRLEPEKPCRLLNLYVCFCSKRESLGNTSTERLQELAKYRINHNQ